ncbi:MAG: flagellar basal body rod protein FlgC [Planctomycetota bacterium]
MDIDSVFTGISISSSGLHAERARMETIARNIANANVLSTPDGGPYRRREVYFETILADNMSKGDIEGSVRITGVADDMETPLREIYDPGHPLADKETGNVQHSNVDMSYEMIDLMSSGRSYEANLKAMKVFKDMAAQALRLLE